MSSPAVGRAVRILDFLGTHASEAFTLSELSRRTGISKATVHSILASLTESGYLVREHDTQRFRIGAGITPLAIAAETGLPALAVARQEARDLADRLDVQCIVVWATAEELIYLSHSGVPRAGGFSARAGQRIPLAPPMATVFLAWAQWDDVDRWLARLGPDADETLLDRYRAALDLVRDRGYAVGFRTDAYARMAALYSESREEVHTPAVRAELEQIFEAMRNESYLPGADEAATMPLANMSAPIFDATGTMVLALSLHLDSRFTGADEDALADDLVRSASSITDRIGGHRPDRRYATVRR